MPNGGKELCYLVRAKTSDPLFLLKCPLWQSKDNQGPLDGVPTVWTWRSSGVYAALSQCVSSPPVALFYTIIPTNLLNAVARSSASHPRSIDKRFKPFTYPARSSQHILVYVQPKRRLQFYHAFYYRRRKCRSGGKGRWGRGRR